MSNNKKSDKPIKMLEIEDEELFLLFSIKPEYSKLILGGRKKIELRKTMPRRKCRYAFIYETSPIKGITGIFSIKKINTKPISELSRRLHAACVEHSFMREYYAGYDTATIIEIGDVFPFDEKIPLTKLQEVLNFTPPQGFCYLIGSAINEINKR